MAADQEKGKGLATVKTLSRDPQVNLNRQDKENGWTPFYCACSSGHVAIVRYLRDFTQRPIDYNLPNTQGSTPFLMACFKGQDKVVELLVADERIDVNQGNHCGRSPVWFASCNGSLRIVKLLLASGRRIETSGRDFEGRTPAEMARKWEHAKIATLLENYEKDQGKVRAELRKELALKDQGIIFVPRFLHICKRTSLSSPLNSSQKLLPRRSSP